MIKINGKEQILQDEVGELKRFQGGTSRDVFAAHCNKFLLDHGLSPTQFGFNNYKPKRRHKCKAANGVDNYEFESDVFP